MNTNINFAGIEMKNPVTVASGTFGYGREVAEYIDKKYDMKNIKKVYICGDGATWIKEGLNWIEKSEFVLDRFHLLKYIIL